jgi:hypothetical protein
MSGLLDARVWRHIVLSVEAEEEDSAHGFLKPANEEAEGKKTKDQNGRPKMEPHIRSVPAH